MRKNIRRIQNCITALFVFSEMFVTYNNSFLFSYMKLLLGALFFYYARVSIIKEPLWMFSLALNKSASLGKTTRPIRSSLSHLDIEKMQSIKAE